MEAGVVAEVDLAAAAGVDVAVVVAVVAVAEEDLLLVLWPLIKDRCKPTQARRSLSEVRC